MKIFIKRILLFSIIPLIYLLPAIVIDPYNILHKDFNERLVFLKSKISYKLNRPLYRLEKYTEQPTDVILLGDSRTDLLKSSTFEKLTHMRTTNLAYGGGSLQEVIKTFWYVIKIHRIKRVYIGINFSLFNEYANRNRVTEALMLKHSPISYLFSNYCYNSFYLILKSIITNKKVEIGKPHADKKEFWKFQLDSSAAEDYRVYKLSKRYQTELIQISDFCAKNNIELVFIIPPTHIDLQNKVKEYKLEDEEKVFKNILSKLGKTYDFDYPNELTMNYSNYNDPYHCNDSIADIIVNEIIANNRGHYKMN